MPDSIQHQKDDAFRNAAGRRRAFPAFLILGLLCVGLALVYVFQGMTPETWDFNMARRIPIVIALVLVGTAVGLSSVVFQTITTNYILTPSVMGPGFTLFFFRLACFSPDRITLAPSSVTA